MISLADHWVRVNGYLIESFENYDFLNDVDHGAILRIDGQSQPSGTSYQECVRICANRPAKVFGSQTHYFNEEDPINMGVRRVD